MLTVWNSSNKTWLQVVLNHIHQEAALFSPSSSPYSLLLCSQSWDFPDREWGAGCACKATDSSGEMRGDDDYFFLIEDPGRGRFKINSWRCVFAHCVRNTRALVTNSVDVTRFVQTATTHGHGRETHQRLLNVKTLWLTSIVSEQLILDVWKKMIIACLCLSSSLSIAYRPLSESRQGFGLTSTAQLIVLWRPVFHDTLFSGGSWADCLFL